MNIVAASLQGIAASVRVLELTDLPPKGDIEDWAAKGGTVEQLYDLIERAPLWLPPMREAATAEGSDTVKSADAKQKEDELLEALSKLRPGVEFAQKRKKAAKELGVSTADIDPNSKLAAARKPLRRYMDIGSPSPGRKSSMAMRCFAISSSACSGTSSASTTMRSP